jgi:hypothetical protein
MQAPIRRRKKRGTLYFNTSKALKTSRMGRKKLATERFETNGISKVLDFEDIEENATLSTVDESQGPSTSRELGSKSKGPFKEMGTQSNPTSTPAMEEHSAEEELEEMSLMELEETSLRELEETSMREREETSLMEQEGGYL